MSKHQINKTQIITAAAQVIAEKGLENGTVDDIAKAAGIAKGSVYEYFDSKEMLLLEGAKYLATQRTNALKKLLVKYSSPIKKLQVLLEANNRMSQKQPEILLMNYALLISSHNSIKTKGALEFFKTYFNLVSDVIAEGKADGSFQVADPKSAALMIILTHDIGRVLNYINKDLVDLDKLQKEIYTSVGV
ncbi:TetR/AcrR family transcriptional regulator [Candidatus Nomurabacteria bacterium]|nr:TetR/AcrR family transcriptional regulator [Candidatus Nomurabacteria bacterium]